jgi:hypothetical protein
MSSCININTPEFQNLVNSTNDPEGVVAAVVNLWQENNATDQIPTSTQYEEYKVQIQGQGFSNMYYKYFEKLAQNLNDNWSKEKGESVSLLLSKFKNFVLDDSKGANLNLPQLALRRLLNTSERGVVTPEYVAEAIESLNMYLNRSNVYLEGMVRTLNTFLKSDATTKQKLGAIYTSYETADNFKRQLEAIFPSTGEFKRMVDYYENNNYVHFKNAKDRMLGNINRIQETFKSEVSDQVVEELWKLYSPNVEMIDKLFDDNLKNLREQLARTTSENQKRLLEEKIKREKEKKEKGRLTKENLAEWISNPKGNWISLMLRSGNYQEDPGVSVVAQYIYNIQEDAQRNFFQEANDLQDIMERIQNISGENVDIRNMYQGLYRETVDEEGNFALAIQTPMKDQELRNERYRLIKNRNEAKTEEERYKAKEELDAFDEMYLERMYKPEYYEFKKSLPKDLQDKLDEARDEKNLIVSKLDGITIEEGALQELALADKKIKDLSREYDDFGNLKSEEEVRNARTIKAYNERARELGVHDFYLENSSKIQFQFALKEQETKLKQVLESAASEEQKEKAREDFANWLSYYSRDVIAPEYYALVKRTTDKIDAILKKYGDTEIGKNYKELYELLRGYRDANGVYDGSQVSSELAGRVKELEEEIERLKDTEDSRKITPEDKSSLELYFAELRNLQVKGNTKYYEEEVKNRKDLIRSELLNTEDWVDNPNLDDEIDRRFENSSWFKRNHIYVERYSAGGVKLVPQPISIWRYNGPSDYAVELLETAAAQKADMLEQEDPEGYRAEIQKYRNFRVVQKRVPSQVWYSYRVNPKLNNPNYSPDLNFKTVRGVYYNEEWDQLSAVKKEIATDLLKLYLYTQRDAYRQNKLRTLVPYTRKEGLELAVDTVRLDRKGLTKKTISEIKAVYNQQDFQNPDTDDVYGEVDQTDSFGNPVERASKVIYARYVQPIDKDLMSFDIMKSIGLYMGEAAKFRALRENQNAILGMQTILETRGINSATRVTEGIINRVLYGENMYKYDTKVANRIASITNFVLRRSGAMSLDYNPMSAIKNLQAGMIQNFIMAGVYDVTFTDLVGARGLALQATADFVANPQVGNRPLMLQILDAFGAIQGRDFTQGAFIKSTWLRKYGNIFKMVHKFREWTEFEIQSTIAFAVMNKVYVQGPNGNPVKLLDAFTLQNKRLVIKDGYIVPEAVFRQVRAKIKHLNHHSQGIYDQLYQPEGTKYVLYRIFFYMGKWRVPKWDRYFGPERIDYMAGVRTKGAWSVIWQFATDVFKYQKNIIAAYQTLTPTEKKQMAPLWKTIVAATSYIVLQSMLKDCDDDGDQDTCDYVNWLAKGVGDEIESMDPIFFPMNFVYGFVDQKTQISAPERIINQVASPLTKVWKIFSDPALRLFDPTEPYYKKTSTGKINWDTTDPAFAGKPMAAVLLLKLSGLSELDVTPKRVEFKSRSFTHFNPKPFVGKTKTRYYNEEGDVKEIKFREKDEEEETGVSTGKKSKRKKSAREKARARLKKLRKSRNSRK